MIDSRSGPVHFDDATSTPSPNPVTFSFLIFARFLRYISLAPNLSVLGKLLSIKPLLVSDTPVISTQRSLLLFHHHKRIRRHRAAPTSHPRFSFIFWWLVVTMQILLFGSSLALQVNLPKLGPPLDADLIGRSLSPRVDILVIVHLWLHELIVPNIQCSNFVFIYLDIYASSSGECSVPFLLSLSSAGQCGPVVMHGPQWFGRENTSECCGGVG